MRLETTPWCIAGARPLRKRETAFRGVCIQLKGLESVPHSKLRHQSVCLALMRPVAIYRSARYQDSATG